MCEPTPTQVCSLCRVPKPATKEFYHSNVRAKTGLHSRCIRCRTGKDRVYYAVTVDHDTHRKNWRAARRQTLRGFIADTLHNSIYGRQKKRWGTDSDLTVDYLLGLWGTQEGRCYWTHLPLAYGDTLSKQHPQKLSFDRLDCALGYVIGNVALTTNFANRGRSDTDSDTYASFLHTLGIVSLHPASAEPAMREAIPPAPVISVEPVVMKTCKTCQEGKPATPDAFHRNENYADGLNPHCIRCRTGKDRQWEFTGLDQSQSNKNSRARRRDTLQGYLSDILWNTTRARQLKRWGIPSDLTVEYLMGLYEQQHGKCYWTGSPLLFGHLSGNQDLQKVSLDRLDCACGYLVGNVVLATAFANIGRGDTPESEFREFLGPLLLTTPAQMA